MTSTPSKKRDGFPIRTVVGAAGAAIGLMLALFARFEWIAPPLGLSTAGFIVAGVLIAMAILWITETLPLAGTSLLPLILFPLFGVRAAKDVAPNYFSSIVVLLLGGFFLARALEHWRVPNVIARGVERWAGGSPTRLFYGLMAVTALLSMWLSNTATTLVMMTVATAAISRARAAKENSVEDVRQFSLALVLGIAYAANMGGIATPVGTAPNAILLGFLNAREGHAPITFLAWMVAAVPFVVVMTPIMAVLMQRVLVPFSDTLVMTKVSDEERRPLTTGARRSLGIFVVIALLWIFRVDIDVSLFVIPGWTSALGVSKFVDEGAIAVLGVVWMMATPSGEKPGERVLAWDVARDVPWSLVLLFGGGLALADSFAHTGLSVWLGEQLTMVKGAPLVVIVLVLTFGMSLLTEVTSNTATTTLLLPVIAAGALMLGIDEVLLMWPAAIAASAAFILPISTPPNAIAAGAADVSIRDMAKTGVWLNALAVILITFFTVTWLPVVLDKFAR